MVEKLQETRQKLNETLKETEVLKEEAEILKLDYEKKLAEVKSDKKKAIKEIKRRFDFELLEAKGEIKKILDELRQEKSEKIARRAYSRLGKLDENYQGKVEFYKDKEEFEAINWDNVKAGDKLMLKDTFSAVTLESLPDNKGRLNVLMGGIKMSVKKDKLIPYNKDFERKGSAYSPSKLESFKLHKINLSNRLDLRGARVEDALNELEIYLDKASLASLSPVTIIHGHGTGALKSAVRDYLLTSPYVAKFRSGEDNEGGDGVSVIDIR